MDDVGIDVCLLYGTVQGSSVAQRTAPCENTNKNFKGMGVSTAVVIMVIRNYCKEIGDHLVSAIEKASR